MSGTESESVAGRHGSACHSEVAVASNNNTKEKRNRKFLPHLLINLCLVQICVKIIVHCLH